MNIVFCDPGRDYPGDKTVLARVITDAGTTLFFRMSPDVSERRRLITLLQLIDDQTRDSKKMKYNQSEVFPCNEQI